MAKLEDNPKKAFGDKKPGLHLNPLSAAIAQWEAQFDGALKYGEVNWREQPVEAMTYIDAAMRHLRLYENGEKYARDTKVQNLGAVMACCAILIDAELHDTLIDNRKHSPESCDLLHERGEEMVKVLRDSQAVRELAEVYNPPQGFYKPMQKQVVQDNKLQFLEACPMCDHNYKCTSLCNG
jgi:hypothetical protein